MKPATMDQPLFAAPANLAPLSSRSSKSTFMACNTRSTERPSQEHKMLI
jgi:hypothetical protein